MEGVDGTYPAQPVELCKLSVLLSVSFLEWRGVGYACPSMLSSISEKLSSPKPFFV
jgi:hypothetical protein